MTALNISLITSNNVQDIEKYISHSRPEARPEVWFDIDDTSVMVGSKENYHLGNIAWRDECRKRIADIKSKRSNPNAPLFGCLTLFLAQSLPAKGVQGNQTSDLINKLTAMGCKVRFFTSRGRSFDKAWYDLNVTGIDALSKKQLQHIGVKFEEPISSLNHSAVFENVMIFCQHQPKEDVLRKLFADKVFDPSQISQLVYIDDKKEPLGKIGQAVVDVGIPSFTGIHYTLVEELEKQEYDSLKATLQFVSLLHSQTLLNETALSAACARIKAQGTSTEDFFKDVLLELDQIFSSSGIYEQVGLSADELFEKMKQAVSGRFKARLEL